MPKRSDLHKELLRLVHQYLVTSGYEKTAGRLVKESGIEIDEAEGHGSLLEIYRTHLNSENINVSTKFCRIEID